MASTPLGDVQHSMELHNLTPASSTMPADNHAISSSPRYDAELHKRTLRKLDFLLLPFLALLFLFNSLDKSNVGYLGSPEMLR
jgi:hypothetical protein